MMDNDFYKNIITLLEKSDIRFRTTEIRPIEENEGIKTVSMNFSDVLRSGQTQLAKTPAISCLIVFTLFDAYIENKYSMDPGISFKQKYNQVPFITNQNIIEKECYRLMKTIRNGFVHNINAIISQNDLFHFNYSSPQGTNFNLDISSDKLELLYSIILILVKGKYEIATDGHFENVICTYYSDLKSYVDTNGNFTDDGNMGAGSVTSFNLMPISSYVHFNTVVRYPIVSSNYDISEGRIRVNIKSISDPGYKRYSTDYCIKYNNKVYIIPQEILDPNNSLSISDLSIWEFNK
ncbi:hypothetical protein [Clostridium autoethanogenum]|uniref:pEK499-p136 HEPN domain-containing protein n=1 Tax=Clostridium autoethanogenum DSM 10061 TaxID=1341692 RepID=A0ABM5NU28_9CLOT|nr:hypothetical protein [Clostridium autoethanogenum]AGY75885.1 hypothetical protein CAETHG_1664 [Clostridium autoethanogenum DSM 10061]ALU36051.1 Hypothetical protein CLAU_1622 [Clostridium autoethanogenum DSM 10061]OVY51891.1 hypothetical protein WX72_00768 [Clostridium autoethanogenum]DAD54171.1 TPA_exp: protein of unknown function KV_052 [Clostridium autoethanogenum DSM 10061]